MATNAERQRAYRERLKARGLIRATLWCDPKTASALGRMKPEELTALVAGANRPPVTDNAELKAARAEIERLKRDISVMSAMIQNLPPERRPEPAPAPSRTPTYPDDAKAIAVRMKSEGHAYRDICAMLAERVGRAPNPSNIGRHLKKWSADPAVMAILNHPTSHNDIV